MLIYKLSTLSCTRSKEVVHSSQHTCLTSPYLRPLVTAVSRCRTLVTAVSLLPPLRSSLYTQRLCYLHRRSTRLYAHRLCCLCQSLSSLYARPLYCCLGCLPVPRNGSTAQHGSTAQERKAHTKAHTNEASLPTAQRPAHQNIHRTHHTRYFRWCVDGPACCAPRRLNRQRNMKGPRRRPCAVLSSIYCMDLRGSGAP
jgi:hypothetical protein